MTDKQINIVEILAEQCKNCTLYEGDTVSLNISIFDRPLKGVCFNNNIYFSVDELNYIMQKLISKEQECKELKDLNTRLDNQRETYWKGYQKLKATITEIKEIAITGLEGFCPKCSRKECEDNNCIETAIRDILQKINECEGNNG